MQIRHIDQQRSDWFESDFCLRSASYIATLSITDDGPFLRNQNFAEICAFRIVQLFFCAKFSNFSRNLCNFTWGWKISPYRFRNRFKLVTWIWRIDQQKSVSFGSNSASYIATLLMTKFCWNLNSSKDVVTFYVLWIFMGEIQSFQWDSNAIGNGWTSG